MLMIFTLSELTLCNSVRFAPLGFQILARTLVFSMEKHEEVRRCYSFVVISAVYSRFSMVTAISIRFLAKFLAMMITLG